MERQKTQPVNQPGDGGSFLSVFILSGVLFTNLFSRAIFSPLLIQLKRDLALSNAQAGRMFLFIYIGFGVSLFLSGMAASRINHRGSITLSLLWIAASLVVLSFLENLAVFFVCLVFLGLGSGLYIASGVAVINRLVRPERLGTALAVHEVGPTLSLILAPLAVELFMNFTGWRGILRITAGINVGMAVVYLLFGKKADFPGRTPNFHNIRDVITQRVFWVVMLLFFLAFCAAHGIYNLLPNYLIEEKGIGTDVVNNFVGTSRISGLASIFLSGLLVDRIGIKRTILLIMVVCGIFTILLGLASGPLLIIAMFLQPILITAYFPAGLAAISHMGHPELRNITVSLVMPVALFSGIGAVPALFGYLGDFHLMYAGVAVLGGLMLASTWPLMRSGLR
ncbi:MAG: MFS transporter [bacterium]